MKLKFYFLMLFLSLLGGIAEIKAQSIVIRTSDGTESTDQLTSLHKFTFSNNQLVLSYNDGTSALFDLSSVDKVFFEDVMTDVNTALLNDGTTLSLYPNPATDLLLFKNLPEDNAAVKIYRMDGKLMLNTQLTSDTPSLDVSTLPNGLYIVKMNDQTLKFIKQ